MKTNWLTTFIKVLIIVMNFSLFFALEVNEGQTLDHPQLFGIDSDLTNTILYTLGFVILILFCYISLIQGIIVGKLQYTRAFSDHDESKKIKLHQKILKPLGYMLSNFEETMQCRGIWCLLLCVGFSLAGILSDFFWFSFTTIYLLSFSPQILEVINAVWEPRNRIISTILLSAVILYWFAIIAYVYFGSDFDQTVGSSNKTLRRCLAVIFDSWYKYGLGAFLSDNGKSAIMETVDEANQIKIRGPRMTFDFLFFFIVPTLLLSILSGIIIDNFGERRSHSDTINEKKSQRCFICGEDSSDIPNFTNHSKYEHNLWDYMYYKIYLS